MNMAFKVIDMCKTCVHGTCSPNEYQTRCKKYASARFAIELLPRELLEDKNQAHAAVACNEYDERDDDDVQKDFTLKDALDMIKEHCSDMFDCHQCRIYHWCKDRDKKPENWLVYEEEIDVCKDIL